MILFVAGAALILAALFFLLPREFSMERSIVVQKPRQTVFGFLKQVQKQEMWNPWLRRDTSAKKESRGQDGTAGFVLAWAGKTSGTGEQEIMSITEGSRVDFELRFQKPFEATNSAFLSAQPSAGDATQITWGMTGKMSFPMNLMHLFMKGRLERDMDEGLGLLKEILET